MVSRPGPAVRATGKSPGRSHIAKSRRHSIANPPTTSVGLVSAVQIPLGGADDDETAPLIGDFNGDGKKDVAKLIYNGAVYQVSTVLSNGDGTFQAAQLTNTPGSSDDPIFVGDVNGDGKDDILQVHPSTTPATVDVLLSAGDGTFTLGTNVQVSAFSLQGGIAIDVNGDGKVDVLTVDSQTPAVISVVLGNGDGTFQAATPLATLTTAAPANIMFADFNGDGVLDFAGTIGNQLQVYLASGGGFLSPVALVTSDAVYNTYNSVASDLTGDGKPEIISTNGSNNTVTVYVNNGDGSFQTGVYYDNAGSSYSYAYGIATGDFNGDGKADVVVGDSYAGAVTVFQGNGDGTLTVPTVGYNTGGYPWTAPLVADFNGDGLADIIEADDSFSLAYLEGYGDGTFRSSLSYYLPQTTNIYSYTYSVAAGDFNGDGIADVVVGQAGNTNAPGVAVFLANPDGSLKPGVTYGTSSNMDYVTVADFNGDGKADIAATDSNAGVVQIFLGNGDGTFTLGQSYATDTAGSPDPTNLTTGDFNQDGKLDLAVANTVSGTVGVLFGNGDGTFGTLTNYGIEGNVYGVTAADLNGDGHLDLAVTTGNSGNDVSVFLANNDNTGTFQAETTVATGSGYAESVAFGDLNGDGKLDMVVSMIEGPIYAGALVVALGNGDGTFQSPNAFPSSIQGDTLGFSHPVNLQLIDFDGDSKLDVVYNNENYGTVGLLYGLGDGTFFDPVEFPTSGYALGLAVADVNGDGAVDVVTGNEYVGGASVMLNNSGSGTLPNFSFSSDSDTATVSAGSSATYNLTVVGKNGYNGTITFACSGLPAHASCSFNPASVVAQGNIALATTLTIHTSGASADLIQPARPNGKPGAPNFLANLAGLGVFGLVLAAGGKKRSRKQMSILFGTLLVAMAFSMMGCGSSSSSSNGTPKGNYTVVVTSTGSGSGAPSHSTNLTLVVK